MQLCCVTTWENQRKSVIRKRPLDPHKSSPHDCRCQIHQFKQLYNPNPKYTNWYCISSSDWFTMNRHTTRGPFGNTCTVCLHVSSVKRCHLIKEMTIVRALLDQPLICAVSTFVFFFQMLRRTLCTHKRQCLRIAAASLKLAPVNRPWGKWATISPTSTMCTVKKRGN